MPTSIRAPRPRRHWPNCRRPSGLVDCRQCQRDQCRGGCRAHCERGGGGSLPAHTAGRARFSGGGRRGATADGPQADARYREAAGPARPHHCRHRPHRAQRGLCRAVSVLLRSWACPTTRSTPTPAAAPWRWTRASPPCSSVPDTPVAKGRPPSRCRPLGPVHEQVERLGMLPPEPQRVHFHRPGGRAKP
jgi:hypothetical protein